MMRTLNARKKADLDWEIDPAYKGLWYLDFGLDFFDPLEEATLRSHLLAVEEFLRKAPFVSQVCLAKLNGLFTEQIKQSGKLDTLYEESSLPFPVFCAQIFSDYLHQLASLLPEEIDPVIHVEVDQQISQEEAILLFCRRRFEHLHLIFTQEELPIDGKQSLMLSLPADSLYNVEMMRAFFAELGNREVKCIPEEFLNEHWEGVDHLLIDPATMGPIAERMLQGFEAAGGTVLKKEGLLGFSQKAFSE